MTKFPKPVTLPHTVQQARRIRKRDVTKSVKIGVIIRLFIVVVELVAVSLYGSSALFMDAIATGVDIVSSLLLLIFIKMADKPPDTNHPYGHGRFEPLAGLQLGIFLIFMGGSMLFQQSFELYHQQTNEVINPYLWIIPTLGVVCLELTYRYLMKIANKSNSVALLSEAAHYRVDAVSSLFAAIALMGAAYFPVWSPLIDHFGAITIAILMIGLGGTSAWENMHQLMDRKPKKAFFQRVKKAAAKVPGVLDTEKIRIQNYGPDAHVSIDIEVDPQLSVDKAHEISQHVRAEIQKEWPAVRDVIVHIEPYYENDH
ncbi:MAG: cation diffusion facilitator family transporter [Chlamydiota bacterium]|nr:cation diffusion facilitator family transporter [Chlamydiota bacterium]